MGDAAPTAKRPKREGDFVGPLRWVSDDKSYEALIHAPAAASADPPADAAEQNAASRFPVLVYLHGAGEMGTNIAEIISEGATGTPPVELYYGRAPPVLADRFVVVSPQTARGWDGARVARLVDFLIADEPQLGLALDPSRVYVTGHSMGGGGALKAAATRRFAACATVACAGSANPAALKGVPVWAFHGKNDLCVPSYVSEEVISGLRRGGASEDDMARLTLYDEAPTPPGYPHAVGHASTIPAYATLELYEWFLAHTVPTDVENKPS